ncbi:MAG TPA: hypothetical protein PKH69_09515 [Thiobacillaceae bacterium]|nr:hypothetical protein [Thiobacillaceae bacterium]HNU64329.1 hypothetical protein [Thiobacillaceae bacterium]
MADIITLPHLRTLLGLHVRHQGEICVIIEVLDEPPSLVLQADAPASLMADHHGRPFEYGLRTYTLPVLTEDRSGLNDALLDLEILD